MTVFQLSTCNNCITLAFRNAVNYDRRYDSMGSTVNLADWHKPVVDVIREPGAGRFLGDVAFLGTEAAFSGRAVSRIGELLGDSGQLLPLLCDDGDFHLWNCVKVIDALDEQASDIVRFTGGEIMLVDRWAFHGDRLRGVTAFKIPQLLRGFTFLTELFVERFISAGLSGLNPKCVWSAL